MKFDTIIIGGGLSGLTCAIRLQKQGQRCAVVSAGQSTLHFGSGSFDLLNFDAQGNALQQPLEGVKHLEESHPYHKLGDTIGSYAEMARCQLIESGVSVSGDAASNHYRFTPMGSLQPTWLTLEEFTTAKTVDDLPKGKILIANFAGFLDFNTKFVQDALREQDAVCDVVQLHIGAVDHLRKNPTEMRAANIAKALEVETSFEEFITKLNRASKGYDWVVLPAVFGFKDNDLITKLRNEVPVRLMLMPTMPPSIPGVRTQILLRREFERLGGVFMLGDQIVEAGMEGQRVQYLRSANHEDLRLVAQNYVLATGHFFSGGLVSTIDKIYEPIFGCDVAYQEGREHWYEADVFQAPNYAQFGVQTDEEFHAMKSGRAFENLYAIGSVLSGTDSVARGCNAGVSMLTALYVADRIMKGC